jgi:hypothetical protein
MGMFAKIANIDTFFYRRRPRQANFRFLFPFAANKRKFAVSVFYLRQTI